MGHLFTNPSLNLGIVIASGMASVMLFVVVIAFL